MLFHGQCRLRNVFTIHYLVCLIRDILRTVRGVTGLLLDFSSDQRGELAGSINRVLNALAHVDDMGYCQVSRGCGTSNLRVLV